MNIFQSNEMLNTSTTRDIKNLLTSLNFKFKVCDAYPTFSKVI